MKSKTLKQRFLAKIKKENGCWVWTASKVKTKLSYGQIWDGERLQLSHRVSYQIYKGKIPKGMTIDHMCRNTLCVNPEHLRVLSLRDNILAGDGPTAKNYRKKFCVHGHPLKPGNFKKTKYGRICRTCSNAQNRKRRRIIREKLQNK